MTDVYDIYREVLGQVNKEENGYLPTDLFNDYARAADRLVFNDYNARLQNPQTAFSEKLKLEDRLSPFEMSSMRAATTGLFYVPDDYAYFRNAKVKGDGGRSAVDFFALTAQLCQAQDDPTINVPLLKRKLDEMVAGEGWVAVQLLDHDQITKRLNSFVPGKRPSMRKPVMERATIQADTGGTKRGFLVYPSSDLSVNICYYRRPGVVKLVFIPDAGTLEPVYDPINSKGFEWEQEAMGDVVNKIVTDFATYIREGGLFQMAKASEKP